MMAPTILPWLLSSWSTHYFLYLSLNFFNHLWQLHVSSQSFQSLELLKQIKTAWRKFPPFLSAFARMLSQSELQHRAFKTAWVTCDMWNASATVLVMFQWSCTQLFIYLFLYLYNPSPPAAQPRLWEEQKLFFYLRMHKELENLAEFCRAMHSEPCNN